MMGSGAPVSVPEVSVVELMVYADVLVVVCVWIRLAVAAVAQYTN